MAAYLKFPRGVKANLDTLAGSSGLIPYSLYWITDDAQFALATSTSAYILIPRLGGANTWSGTQTFSGTIAASTINAAAGVSLQYNGSTKLATTTGGVSVTGTLSSTSTLSGSQLLNTPLSFQRQSNKTIASDAITVTTADYYFLIDTEGAAASDDLTTINGGTNGQVIIMRPPSGRTVTLKTTGNLSLVNDVVISAGRVAVLMYDSNFSTWQLLSAPGYTIFSSTLSGAVPASGGGTTNFLRADGTWAAPPGGGGTTTNALTINNSGSGAASGSTFNGSSAVTISYNSIGAMPTTGGTFSGDIVVPAEAYASGWNGSNEAPTKNDVYDEIEKNKLVAVVFYLNGGGSAVAAGQTVDLPSMPFAGTIQRWTITSNASTTCVVTVSKATYANFPTMTAISGTEKPSLSAAQKAEDTSLTSWTTAIAQGDILRASVDSNNTASGITITLWVLRT